MIPILEATAAERSSAANRPNCDGCRNGEDLDFGFSYAYQPIVDIVRGTIFAHEALIRGVAGESAQSVLSNVTDQNRYKFDQACRVKAISTAAALQMDTRLSINFLPNAIYRPEVCIRTTLETAKLHNFPLDRIMFETIEGERVADIKWFAGVLREYKKMGFLTAIVDFGAGYAGLNMLADFQPDVVKLDMDLIRDIDKRRAAQTIVRGVVRMCEELHIKIIAEGIENQEEFVSLQSMGIRLMQGYLFARPQFEACASAASITWPRQGLSNETLTDDVFGSTRGSQFLRRRRRWKLIACTDADDDSTICRFGCGKQHRHACKHHSTAGARHHRPDDEPVLPGAVTHRVSESVSRFVAPGDHRSGAGGPERRTDRIEIVLGLRYRHSWCTRIRRIRNGWLACAGCGVSAGRVCGYAVDSEVDESAARFV